MARVIKKSNQDKKDKFKRLIKSSNDKTVTTNRGKKVPLLNTNLKAEVKAKIVQKKTNATPKPKNFKIKPPTKKIDFKSIIKHKVINSSSKLTDTMNRFEKRIAASYTKPQTVDVPVVHRDYGTYEKQINVDYDVVICVTSFERYEKIRRIIKQLHTQDSKYTFKFIMLNDASTDTRYDKLPSEFPNIIYLKNDENGGKVNYWRTVNKLWAVGKQFKSHTFLQIDDDFILCKNFLDILMDGFFKKKEEDNSIMLFSYHIYGYDLNKPQADWWYNGVSIAIDGGTMFDTQFMKMIGYKIADVNKHIAAHTSTFVWDTLVGNIRSFGVKVYRMPNSLAWHDGNFDSKLNFEARKSKKSYTKGFIDGDDIQFKV